MQAPRVAPHWSKNVTNIHDPVHDESEHPRPCPVHDEMRKYEQATRELHYRNKLRPRNTLVPPVDRSVCAACARRRWQKSRRACPSLTRGARATASSRARAESAHASASERLHLIAVAITPRITPLAWAESRDLICCGCGEWSRRAVRCERRLLGALIE